MRTAGDPSSVIAPATSRNECDVTRDVHNAPVMLNSLTKPMTPNFLQITELVFLRETAEAHRALLSGANDAVDLPRFRRPPPERGQRRARRLRRLSRVMARASMIQHRKRRRPG
jgi:hypothetical protein